MFDDLNKNCPCVETSCPRHGNCIACQEHHHKRGEKTSCEK